MHEIKLIGVDMGASNVRAGLVQNGKIIKHSALKLPSNKGYQEVLDSIMHVIKEVYSSDVTAIGVGVPSVVDRKNGIVYNVQNIPSWHEVALKSILEERFQLPVFVNNDANCFALGERIYGKGQKYLNFVGLAIGTGVGGGIINNGKLLRDVNCGSGEFGEMPYLESKFEDYCSGVFFDKFHLSSGEQIFNLSANGDVKAQLIVADFAKHLGFLLKTIICALDPEAIIIGGSIAKAKDQYHQQMLQVIQDFPYPRTIERLQIEYTDSPENQILGSAALYFDNLA